MSDVPYGDRLLVIDEEPAFRRTIERVATGCGFEVIATGDPVEFLNSARQWHPTVIMLDLKMSGTDGIELLRTLAADKCPAKVVLSSGADPKVIETAIELGRERGLNMSEVLQKPARRKALHERFRGLRRMPNIELAADLADAIARDRLFLEFQPKFDCRASRITGVEALARWRHPAYGTIPPDRFVALAEENGLIGKLTDWVVSRTAAQAAQWRARRIRLEVAVNVSAENVETLDFPDRIEALCRGCGLDPACMTIELTERGAMRGALQMMDVLTRLRLKGFKLSIDDFGTGHSSLVQLQRMPFSEIKIHRSFVTAMTRNSGCKAIVEIVIGLARKLGLKSVAEGVEDAAVLAALKALGCDTVQGYHISRPVSADRIVKLVCGQRRRRRSARLLAGKAA